MRNFLGPKLHLGPQVAKRRFGSTARRPGSHAHAEPWAWQPTWSATHVRQVLRPRFKICALNPVHMESRGMKHPPRLHVKMICPRVYVATPTSRFWLARILH